MSNSGKTYSVSGGNTINSADRGVLPRAIDVVFNSIKGLESTASVSFAESDGIGLMTSYDVRDWQILF